MSSIINGESHPPTGGSVRTGASAQLLTTHVTPLKLLTGHSGEAGGRVTIFELRDNQRRTTPTPQFDASIWTCVIMDLLAPNVARSAKFSSI